ncbi:MAG: DUF1385 domain-containing protein [Solirubrobacterales bacterium]
MKTKFQYGGQAVIEGVMMRGPNRVAVAVRKPDGEIEVETEEKAPLTARSKILSWPFIRGTFVLVDSLVIGIRALNRSASLAMEGEEEELTPAEILGTGLIAAVLAVFLFIALPTGAVHFTTRYIPGGVLGQNLIEGIIRILVMIGYILAISRMEDIRRVFMYHGAEHKAVHALESGGELSVEAAQRFSVLHPRCGTSFLLVVMIISILIFALLGEGSLVWRIGSRIAVFPIVAGLGYEFIKLTSRYADAGWSRFLMAPGLWLQKLTTGEPDEAQIEVAVRALEAVVEPAAG